MVLPSFIWKSCYWNLLHYLEITNVSHNRWSGLWSRMHLLLSSKDTTILEHAYQDDQECTCSSLQRTLLFWNMLPKRCHIMQRYFMEQSSLCICTNEGISMTLTAHLNRFATAFAWSGQELIKPFPTAYKPVSNWTQVKNDWTHALYLDTCLVIVPNPNISQRSTWLPEPSIKLYAHLHKVLMIKTKVFPL